MEESGERNPAESQQSIIAQKIEVGFSDKGEKPPSLLVSVPVYHREWTNGNFLRHLEGHLHSRLKRGDSLEVNYILNYQANQDSDFAPDNQAYHTTVQMSNFLRKVVRVQQLAKEASKLSRKETEKHNSLMLELIAGETNEETKRILALASQKAGVVNFSFVDISKAKQGEFSILGYPRGGEVLGSLRTFGSDYARKRLEQSPNSIFQLSDCDTLPSSNWQYQHLIDYYREHPDIPSHFSNYTFQLPGDDELIFSKFPFRTIKRTSMFAMKNMHPTSQISCRASYLSDEKLESIRSIEPFQPPITGVEGIFEDLSTSSRLMSLIKELTARPYPEDIFLTMDKPEGLVEGNDDRKFYGVTDISSFLNSRDRLLERIQQSEGEQADIQQDLEQCRIKYRREMQKQRLFYVLGAREFVDGLDKGTIKVVNGTLVFDPASIKSERVQYYLEKHKEFLGTMTEEDTNWLKYLLGKTGTKPIGKLTPKQEAMRDFFGTYQDVTEVKRQLWDKEKDKDPRTSRLYGVIAETLALGEVYRKHFAQKDAWEGIKSIAEPGFKAYDLNASPESITQKLAGKNPMTPYDQRTKWLENVA